MKVNWFNLIKKPSFYLFVICAVIVITSNIIVNNNAKEKLFTSASKHLK